MTWTLAGRENSEHGDAEIWTAHASTRLADAAVTATATKKNYDEAITVVAFQDATGTGTVALSHAAAGAPAEKLTTTAAGSRVIAVGNDWLRAASRTPGTGQVVVQESVTSRGDTYWVQAPTQHVPAARTTVTINDTAPTADPYNLVLIEIH